MKIQNKLFLFLFSFSLILVTVLVLLMQWSIGKGMVEYVVSKEVETLKPVVSKLAQAYEIDNNWRSMTGNHHKFRQLISQQLDDSDFDDHQINRPPKKNRFNKKDHLPPHLKEKRPSHRKRGENRPPPTEK